MQRYRYRLTSVISLVLQLTVKKHQHNHNILPRISSIKVYIFILGQITFHGNIRRHWSVLLISAMTQTIKMLLHCKTKTLLISIALFYNMALTFFVLFPETLYQSTSITTNILPWVFLAVYIFILGPVTFHGNTAVCRRHWSALPIRAMTQIIKMLFHCKTITTSGKKRQRLNALWERDSYNKLSMPSAY